MQTIGERLEEARKRKGISIREAAEATKIRGDYLHKYENNQFDIKLPEIYVRGFLRTYATYLKLPGDKIINDYHALGLGDSARGSRSLSREVYGRMDISVANAKTGNPAETPSSTTTPTPSGSDVTPGDKNPATFRPRAPGGLNIDTTLLLKGSALVAGVILLVVLLIWGIGALTSDKPASNITWVKPQPGERTLGLVGVADTELVTVTDAGATVLYRGPLKSGEIRPVPRNSELTIQTETPQSVMIELNGRQWPLKDPKTGQFSKRSTIQAPTP
jgi:transcriptional regulator with XRE-family HTH domain